MSGTSLASGRYAMNGQFYPDRELAVLAARERIRQLADEMFPSGRSGLSITEIAYERFVPEEPPGTIVIEGSVRLDYVGQSSRFCLVRPAVVFSLEVQEVSALTGSLPPYIARWWTRKEIERWHQFAKHAEPDDYRGCSLLEVHYANLALEVSQLLAKRESLPEFLNGLAKRWEASKTDSEKDKCAEVLLSAFDLGLGISFHEAINLCPDLMARIEGLQRGREAHGT